MGCDQKNHGWKVRAETKAIEYLYGACLNIKLTIGNVFVDQNFFVSRQGFLPNHSGSALHHCSKNGGKGIRQVVRSPDGSSVQFLSDHPMKGYEEFFQDF